MAADEKTPDDIKKRNSSICSLDEVSIADHEKAILSPRPVPFEPESLTGPYLAALERGNQSRSHSLRSSLNSLPSKNSQIRGLDSSQGKLSNDPRLDLIREKSKNNANRKTSFKSWKYLCCVSDRGVNEEKIDKSKPLTKQTSVRNSIVSSWTKNFGRKTSLKTSTDAHICSDQDKKISVVDPNNNAITPTLEYNLEANKGENSNVKKAAPIINEKKDIRNDTNSDISDEISSDDYPTALNPNAFNNLLGHVRREYEKKKCLVLDLDETLVHSTFQQFENCDFNITVEIEGREHEVGVAKRPYLKEFLDAVGPLFECVMFTASLKKYADPVCDKIDPKNHLVHRLFRESCVFHQENYIKDLSRLGRDIDQVCIIDNSPASFLFQPNHAIHIITWYDDPEDVALMNLIPYLNEMSRCENIPDFLKKNPFPPRTVIDVPIDWFLNQQAHLMINNYTVDTDDENTPDIDEADLNHSSMTQLSNAYQMKSQYNDSSSSYQKTKSSNNSQPKFIHQAVKQPNQ